MKTLADVHDELENGNTKNALALFIEYLKNEDKAGANNLLEEFKKISDGLGKLLEAQENDNNGDNETRKILTALLNKEQKEIEFPKVQEVSMPKPDWYKEYDWDSMYEKCTLSLVKAFQPFFVEMTKTIVSEGEKTRQALNDYTIEEDGETKTEPKTVNTAALRNRRTTQWKIATYPQVIGTSGLISGGDGKTFYLPSAIIPNSETIRINQAIPLSHGIDYTITGNKIVYALDQTGQQQEVRYQVK